MIVRWFAAVIAIEASRLVRGFRCRRTRRVPLVSTRATGG